MLQLQAIERVADKRYARFMNNGVSEREAADHIVRYLTKFHNLFTTEDRCPHQIYYIGCLIEAYSFII